MTIPIQTQRLRRLLRRMLDIYSPSGKEEEILHFLHGYLKRHGLPVVQQPVDENRYNLLVIPPEVETQLVFVGHIDTVAAYDLDHLGYEEHEDRIIGLGAADMKGGCAAMVEAYLAHWEKGGHRTPAALALVVGEEEEGDGTKELVREFHFPSALIGEPTDLQLCLSHYGYVEVQLTATGRRMHASLANHGHNPIESMLRLLLKISHYLGNDHQEVVYNIRELSSSRSGFAVPERCDAWLDLHLPPTAHLGEITQDIEEIFTQERRDLVDFRGTLRFLTIHAGYELPEKGALVEILKTIYAQESLPWTPHPFRSHSDANLLWAAGTKPILLGPGQLEDAHIPDESVSFDQVLRAAQIYYRILESLAS